MITLKNLDGLHASVRSNVAAYADKLMSALGTNVKSVAVYGSAAGADYVPGRSNVNIVVVVDKLSADMLACLVSIVEIGKRQRIVPPLIVTPEYVRSSLDVFPIEYQEIRDSQVVIYGDDAIGPIDVSRDHLRLECESQLRAAILRTRQAYLEMGARKRGAEQVLHASLTSLVPVLRAMLRLAGTEPPRGKADVIKAVGETFGIPTATFTAILRDKAGDEKIGGSDALRVLGSYIDEVEVLASRLDRM